MALPDKEKGLRGAGILLETTQKMDTANAQTQLLLGRAACLQGDYLWDATGREAQGQLPGIVSSSR